MRDCVVFPNTNERWCQAKASDKIIPQWSLRQSCLVVVKDCLMGWSRERGSPPVTPENAQDNPFLDYPIHLRQDLLNSLLRLKPDSRELLKAAELLVTSGIEDFNMMCLNDCKFTDVVQVVNKLTAHGKSLRDLTLAGQWLYWELSKHLVHNLLESVSNLNRLWIQHTTKEGKELEIIARCCPKLKSLRILHPSTDDDDLDDLVKLITSDPCTQRMRYNLKEFWLPSSVNAGGVMSVLRAFPNVDSLSCTFLEDLLDLIEENEDQKCWWKNRMEGLKQLRVVHPMGFDGVRRLVKWCPNLEVVSLEVQEDMDLKPLCNLTNLRSLELCNSPNLSASYTEEIQPIISTCGPRLLDLSLSRFDVLDLGKIAYHCPNLESLSVRWFTLLGCKLPKKCSKPFSQLQFLCLRPRVSRKVAPEACDLLLSHSLRLRHLEIYSCYGLNDELASKITKSNPLSQLEILLLRHGHGLTSIGIRQLSLASHKLKVWDVGNVPIRSNEAE